jgi:iron complex outermembrane recepter protein
MHFKRLLACSAAFFALPILPAAAQTRLIDVPSEEAAKSIPELARQAGIEIVAPVSQLHGVKTPAVSGEMDLNSALRLLLAGTGLEVAEIEGTTVILTQSEPPPPQSGLTPSQDEIDDESIETIVVTGTSIRGGAPTGSNVIPVNRQQMTKTGATTLQQLLSTIPEISGFGNGTQFGAGSISASGENVPTIHNLGASSSASTLILMNGRPLTPSGNLGLSDPNIIPTIALERIDVMPDGDSAVYGSSAVAGVINFVTRSDYEGLQLNAQFGSAQNYQNFVADILTGHRWETGSVLFAWEYKSNSQLLAENRGFSRSANLTSLGGANFDNFYCSPATISGSSASNTPLFNAPYNGASIGTSVTATPTCDSSGGQSLLPSSEQHNAFLDFKQNVGSRIRIDLNAGYDYRVTDLINPLPAFTGTAFGPTGTSQAIGAASQNPFYLGNSTTGTGSEFVRWDPTPLLGPSHTKGGVQDIYANLAATIDIGRGWQGEIDYTAGLDNAFVSTWDAFCSACASLALNGTTNSAATANDSVATTALSDPNNLGTVASITRALNTGNALDVWDPVDSNKTSAAVLKELKGDSFTQQNRIGMNDAKLKFDGPVFRLPAGDLKVAIGGEFQQINYEQLQTTSDAAGPSVASSQNLDQILPRTVWSGFMEFAIPMVNSEMSIPLIQKLDVQVAGRYDGYSDFGATRNPKLGFDWLVLNGLKARGSYGTSFTAPSVIFLQGINTVSTGNTAFTIPVSQPAYASSFCTTLSTPCTVGPNSPFPGIQIGGPNTALKPMTGQSWSAGLDITAGEFWQPLTGWSTNVTWWRTKFNDAITLVSPIGAGFLTTPGLQQYLQVAPPGGWSQTSPTVLSALSNGLVTSPLPQTIYYIADQIRVNGFSLIGDGIDFDTQYTFGSNGWGDFQLGYAGSWKLDWDVKGGPNGTPGPYISYLNGRFDTSVIKAEAFEGRANFGWSIENWDIDLFWNYTNPYWFQTSTGPFAASAVRPAGFPNSLYSGGFQRVAANSTFDINLAYTLPAAWMGGWARGMQLTLNVKNIASRRPPFFNMGGIGQPSTSYNGFDNFNADPLQRVISFGFSKTM